MTVLLVALGGAAACSGDDDDDGVDAGGGTPDAAAGVAPTCTEYCTRVTTNCSGLNIQYTDMAECMSYCGAIAWTPGVDDPAQDGDTLGCRQYHAGAAGSTGMPDVHCPHAGPTGANVCGTACDVYCDNLEKNCAADTVKYADRAACTAACAGMTEGTPADAAGDTAFCRVYHSGVPAFTDATTHCPHARQTPTAVCVP
ncbi:MAG TPA: hypothetical protein VK698_27835 [Kofleriaceae bacterium]|nr:hypothetical protein [Kofleriaceae bacterium]